jgi:hypothetical protein
VAGETGVTRRSRDVHAGGYYRRDRDGTLVPTTPGRPDVWICRRMADYPGHRAPEGAGLAACDDCGETIAFNPARIGFDVTVGTPRVCLQCAGIEPLPMEGT